MLFSSWHFLSVPLIDTPFPTLHFSFIISLGYLSSHSHSCPRFKTGLFAFPIFTDTKLIFWNTIMIILLCLNIVSGSWTERKFTDLDCYPHMSIDYQYCKLIHVETMCSSRKFSLKFNNRIIYCLQCFPTKWLLWSNVVFLKLSSAFEKNLGKSEQSFREARKPDIRTNHNSEEAEYMFYPLHWLQPYNAPDTELVWSERWDGFMYLLMYCWQCLSPKPSFSLPKKSEWKAAKRMLSLTIFSCQPQPVLRRQDVGLGVFWTSLDGVMFKFSHDWLFCVFPRAIPE